jgi:hypothetical protein
MDPDSTFVEPYKLFENISFNLINYDSAIVNQNTLVGLDSTNTEEFYTSGFAKYGYFRLKYGKTFDDFQMAKELRYSDPSMESIFNEKFWKDDHRFIKGNEPVDPTMSEHVRAALPSQYFNPKPQLAGTLGTIPSTE